MVFYIVHKELKNNAKSNIIIVGKERMQHQANQKQTQEKRDNPGRKRHETGCIESNRTKNRPQTQGNVRATRALSKFCGRTPHGVHELKY